MKPKALIHVNLPKILINQIDQYVTIRVVKDRQHFIEQAVLLRLDQLQHEGERK